jgi:hypothetical protein
MISDLRKIREGLEGILESLHDGKITVEVNINENNE